MHTLLKLLEQSHRILFIGVGNVLKRDDGVGVLISQGIIESPDLLTLTVEVSIENYIGKINSLEPEIDRNCRLHGAGKQSGNLPLDGPG